MTTQTQLFRQQALAHVAAADTEDSPPAVIRPLDWLLLNSVLVLTLLALVFAVIVQAPVKVAGRGMLLQSEGIATVIAEHEGLIEQVLVVPGQRVGESEIVALLAQPELQRALHESEAVLANARSLERETKALLEQEARQDDELTQRQARSTKQRRQAALAREAELARRQADTQALLEKGFGTRVALQEIENNLAMARSLLAEIDAEASRNARARQTAVHARRARVLEVNSDVERAERQVEQARRRLAEGRELRSRSAGIVSEIQADQGAVVRPGTPVIGLLPEIGSGEMQALVYVPAGQGKSIVEDMVVAVVPEAVRRDVFGHIEAEVTRVAPLPATAEGMMQRFGNAELVRELSANGLAMEIEVRLALDADTPSGFAWSTLEGPDRRIDAGTIVQAEIVVRQRPLLSFLLPSLEDRLMAWRQTLLAIIAD